MRVDDPPNHPMCSRSGRGLCVKRDRTRLRPNWENLFHSAVESAPLWSTMMVESAYALCGTSHPGPQLIILPALTRLRLRSRLC